MFSFVKKYLDRVSGIKIRKKPNTKFQKAPLYIQLHFLYLGNL